MFPESRLILISRLLILPSSKVSEDAAQIKLLEGARESFPFDILPICILPVKQEIEWLLSDSRKVHIMEV